MEYYRLVIEAKHVANRIADEVRFAGVITDSFDRKIHLRKMALLQERADDIRRRAEYEARRA